MIGLNASNRYDIYRGLRENMPVYRSVLHSAWVVSRYADASFVLKHPDALALEVMPFLQSVAQRGALELDSLLSFCSSLSLLTRPPRHDAVRTTLARAEALLDEASHTGAINLADGYGRLLALYTMGIFLGIPEADLLELGALARDFMAIFERTVLSVRVMRELNGAVARLSEYFVALLRDRRRSPRDDGMSIIVQCADQAYGPGDEELAQNCLFFFIAAEETTSAAISSSALTLLQRPELCARLRDDPRLLHGLISDLLRLASPVQYVARQFSRDCMIAGQLIRAGEPVMTLLGAANRDPEVFPDPDEPLFDRGNARALVFAAGPYSCVGAQLATLEVEVALTALLARRDLELSAEPPTWSSRMNISPLSTLTATFAH